MAIKRKKPNGKDSKQQVSFDTVLHVARLARLRLSLEDARKYQKDMNDILTAFNDIKKVKTSAVPSFHPMDVKDTTRRDEIDKSLPHETALANTKHKEKGFFKGPRAV